MSKNLYLTQNPCIAVKIEYIVANALVELYEKKNINKISLDLIRLYGIAVEKYLLNNNINSIFLYSNHYIRNFLYDYSDFFKLIGNDIVIKENITVDDIREHILSYISFDVLSALFSKESLMILDLR